MPRGAPWLR
ncbi:unnamed protein product, partial [Didymodactylos carnosus]